MCLVRVLRIESQTEYLMAVTWGPKQYLTYEEESELVEFIIKCSKMGYGKTRQDMMKLVESCLVKKKI